MIKAFKSESSEEVKAAEPSDSDEVDHTYNPYSFARLEKAVFKNNLKEVPAIKETANAISKF